MSVATFMRRVGLVVTAVWLAAGQARGDIYSISGTFGQDANKNKPTGLAGGTFAGTFTANMSKSQITGFDIELYTKNHPNSAFMHLDVTKANIKVTHSGSGSKKMDTLTFTEGSVKLSVSMLSSALGVTTVLKDKNDTLSAGKAQVAVTSFKTADKSSVASAPEPSTFLPAMFGSVAFAGYFWRRRSRAIAA